MTAGAVVVTAGFAVVGAVVVVGVGEELPQPAMTMAQIERITRNTIRFLIPLREKPDLTIFVH